MPSVALPTDIHFAAVERPSAVVRSSLPAALVQAVEETARSGKAIRVDASTWEPRVANAFYRRVLALNREPAAGLTIHGRRDDGSLWFWATRGIPRRKKRASRA
jgi:hypothetical protein